MAEATNGSAPPERSETGDRPQLKLQILAQFIRDMSFENIVAQKGIQGEVTPDIQVQVALDVRKRTVPNQFEVISKYNVKSRNKGSDATLYLLELEYAGIFMVEGVPEDQLHPLLLIECPRLVFPFARRIIADVTRDGGFPQLNLDNIDFVQLYRQTLLQRQADSQSAGTPASPGTEGS